MKLRGPWFAPHSGQPLFLKKDVPVLQMDPSSNFLSYRSTLRAAVSRCRDVMIFKNIFAENFSEKIGDVMIF
jgi:hypothetical protein